MLLVQKPLQSDRKKHSRCSWSNNDYIYILSFTKAHTSLSHILRVMTPATFFAKRLSLRPVFIWRPGCRRAGHLELLLACIGNGQHWINPVCRTKRRCWERIVAFRQQIDMPSWFLVWPSGEVVPNLFCRQERSWRSCATLLFVHLLMLRSFAKLLFVKKRS